MELNPSVSLKQQKKPGKKTKNKKQKKKKKKRKEKEKENKNKNKTPTILARLLWGVKATLLWKGSVNPYYAEINGSPIFADCTRRRVTRAQRLS